MEDKTLKKPEKIIPCPRCDSMDTKFCYYNNYNVNQPRHFCKNCQRYWTAGGIMRNVPVGAGRRMNKNFSASNYHQNIDSEAIQAANLNVANRVHHPSLGNSGTVFTFFAENTQICDKNWIHRGEDCGGDHQRGPSITASNSSEKKSNAVLIEPSFKNYQGFPSQVPCFSGPHWPSSWNPVQWNWAMHPPAFSPSGFPVPFYPPPTYWGSNVPGSCNISCMTLPSPPLGPCTTPSCNLKSPLGKHSREGDVLNPVKAAKEEPDKWNDNSEGCLLIPKISKIDGPTEAAKSAIWTALGIENEERTIVSNGKGLFKAFQPTSDNKIQAVKTSPLLEANPAALSRSLNFHEIT